MRKITLRSDTATGGSRARLGRAAGLLSALLIASAAVLATGTPASADGDCFQSSCDGRSPVGTNCAIDALTLDLTTDGQGTASLLHSDICDASWTVIEVGNGAIDEYGGAYYVPQLGGTEVEVNIGAIDPASNGTSTMISGEDSVKSCFTTVSSNFDPDPEQGDAPIANGGCTGWH